MAMLKTSALCVRVRGWVWLSAALFALSPLGAPCAHAFGGLWAEPDAKLAIAAALRNDTASRARVLAMLHTLVPLETHAGLEAAALAVALEGFTPETQAKIELATRSPVATERALAFRVFVRALDMRRALEGLFDIDEGVRFGIAVQVLDP